MLGNVNSVSRYEQYEVYFNALDLAGKRERLFEKLKRVISEESNITVLFKYVKLAENYNMQELAEDGYRQILLFAPDNLDAVKGMGVSAFSAQTYSISYNYIKLYNEKTGGDYLTNYIYGELLFYRGNLSDYDIFLEKALKQVTGIDKDKRTLKSYLVEAAILFRLERGPEAVKIYRDCIKKYPEDLTLKLDFADFLLNLNRVNDCKKILSKFPEPKITKKSRLMAYYPVKSLKDLRNDEIVAYSNLIRVRLFLKEQRLDKAFTLLDKINEVYPHIATPRYYLAETDTYTLQGNWRKELDYLEKITDIQPANEIIFDRYEDVERMHSSTAEVNTGLKISSDQAGSVALEYITKAKVDLRVSDFWKIGVSSEMDLISSKNIQRIDGSEGPYTGVKFRTELYSEFDFAGNSILNGSNLKLSYYIANGYDIIYNSGFGLEYKYLDNWGNTQLQVDYRRPYWEIPSGVVEGAFRDRISLGRFLKIIPSLNLYGEFAFNHYGVQDVSTAGYSISFIVRANYALPITEIQEYVMGNNSRLFFNYELNSEIFTDIATGINSSGSRYRILPLADRLVNTVSISAYKQFNRDLEADAYIGYAFDALGDHSNGPVAGARVRYKIFDCLVAEVYVDHSIGVTTSTYVGGSLKWYYGECLGLDNWIQSRLWGYDGKKKL